MPPPGATDIASHSPSGDHATPPTGSSSAVTIDGHPPEEEAIDTWGDPLRFERKASRSPAGEKLGDDEEPTLAMRATLVSRSSSAAWTERETPSAAAKRTERDIEASASGAYLDLDSPGNEEVLS